MNRADEVGDFARFYVSSPRYWVPGVLAFAALVLSVLYLCGVGR